MPIVAVELDKDRLHKRLLFLLRRADKRFIDEVISTTKQQFTEEIRERDLQRSGRLNYVDNSDEIARKLHRHYRIQGLTEILLPIFVKVNLDEEDTCDAIELALQKVF